VPVMLSCDWIRMVVCAEELSAEPRKKISMAPPRVLNAEARQCHANRATSVEREKICRNKHFDEQRPNETPQRAQLDSFM
jgi:hypothetical protein